MSRSTALICALAMSALLWAPQALARTTTSLDGEVPVPDVTGIFYIEGVIALQDAGFNPSLLVGNLTTARITDQCPRGGTLAAPGSFVRLRISGTFSDCPGSPPPPGDGGGGSGGTTASGAAAPLPTPQLVPLIFIPGIMGSRLVNNVHLLPDDHLWPEAAIPPGQPGLFNDLSLSPDLQNQPGENVESRGPVLGLLIFHAYDRTVDKLKEAGYEEGDGRDATLFTFGYDWRRSAVDDTFDKATQRRLAQEIRDVMDQTRRSRVDILAHSQGGLVTMAFLATHQDLAQHVRRVVTIATPILGAAKAIGIAKWAKPCEFGELIGICKADMNVVRNTVLNMPGVYELFPPSGYAAAVGTSPITSPDGHQLSFANWIQILRAPDHPLNEALINEADGVHLAIFDRFDPTGAPYKMLRIIGSGPKSTPVAFREVPNKKLCVDLHRFCKYTTNGIESDSFYGDGTVAAQSASLVGTCDVGVPACYNHQPASVTNRYVDGLNHMQLAQDAKSLNIALRFFGARTVSGLRRTTADDAPPPDIDGTDLPNENAPAPPTGTEVNVWGSADVSASDVAGDAVPVGSFLNEQLLAFDAPGTYAVTIRPTDAYPLKVAVERIAGSVQQQSTFFVPSPRPGQVLTLAFTSDQDLAAARLAVDANGDGTVDETLAPSATTVGDTTADGTPPTTIGGGTITDAGTSSVQLLARDDASGVGSSYIVTSDDAPALRYDGPFTVTLYSTVYFLSVDKQGNDEEPQSIVADDAPGYRELAAPIAVDAKLDRTIFPQGDEDWFRFDADGTSNYRAQLYGLTSDYDLELVGADGTVLQAPHTRSSASEQVRGVLPAGTYYLHVVGVAGAADRDHPYKLKLQTLGH